MYRYVMFLFAPYDANKTVLILLHVLLAQLNDLKSNKIPSTVLTSVDAVPSKQLCVQIFFSSMYKWF